MEISKTSKRQNSCFFFEEGVCDVRTAAVPRLRPPPPPPWPWPLPKKRFIYELEKFLLGKVLGRRNISRDGFFSACDWVK